MTLRDEVQTIALFVVPGGIGAIGDSKERLYIGLGGVIAMQSEWASLS